MSAESEEVTVELLHVHLEMRCALRPVYQHRHTVRVGNAYHLPHRIDRSEDVAHMGDTHYLGALREHAGIRFHVKLALIVHRYHPDSHSATGSLKLPRHDVGMVFHHGNDDFIALFHEFLAERGRHEIDALCRSACENHLLGLSGIDETAHRLARRLMQFGCLLRQIVHTTVHVGVGVEILMPHGVEHTKRLLRRGGIVEIYQRSVVDCGGKYGKILAYGVYIVCHNHVLMTVKPFICTCCIPDTCTTRPGNASPQGNADGHGAVRALSCQRPH